MYLGIRYMVTLYAGWSAVGSEFISATTRWVQGIHFTHTSDVYCFCYRMPHYIICICWLMRSTLHNYCLRHATNTLYRRLASQFSLHTMISGSFTTVVLSLLFFLNPADKLWWEFCRASGNSPRAIFSPFPGYRSCLYTTLQGKVTVFKVYIGSLVRKQCHPKMGFQDTSNIL